VRDYIHVMDLAEGHVQALAWLQNQTGAHVFNLGAGRGYSVLEMVKAFEPCFRLPRALSYFAPACRGCGAGIRRPG